MRGDMSLDLPRNKEGRSQNAVMKNTQRVHCSSLSSICELGRIEIGTQLSDANLTFYGLRNWDHVFALQLIIAIQPIPNMLLFNASIRRSTHNFGELLGQLFLPTSKIDGFLKRLLGREFGVRFG
jgi:hypothetical protein